MSEQNEQNVSETLQGSTQPSTNLPTDEEIQQAVDKAMENKLKPIPGAYYLDLQMRINELVKESDFVGSFLQVINCKFDRTVPTACVGTNAKERSIQLRFGPDFYDELTTKQRVAILKHEVLHIVFKHIYQFRHIDKRNFKLYNVAMDMVINQYIKDLPEFCIDVANFRSKDGTSFPTGQTVEKYVELLTEDGAQVNSPMLKGAGDKQGDESEENCEGQAGEDGGGSGDKYQRNADGSVKREWKDIEKESGTNSHDSHEWDECDDSIVADKVKAAKNRHERSFSKCPDCVDEFLDGYYKKMRQVDYKRLLKNFINSKLPANDTELTWTRPSKRFGLIAQGTRQKRYPSIAFYGDTSGSIGQEELNEFLGLMNDVFTTGVRETTVNLFHTSVYHSQKYKKNSKIEKTQSGGTDLTDVFNDIHKKSPNLAIILTDGYYDVPDFSKKLPNTKVVFLVRNDLNVNHPAKHLGETIVYKSPGSI